MPKPRYFNALNTQGRSYSLEQSPFYKLTSLKRLFSLLDVTADDLPFFEYRQSFSQRGRKLETPEEDLSKIHHRIASLFSRIQTPDYLHSTKKGYSYRSNALVHLNSNTVLHTDIKHFFPSITRQKIAYFFRNELHCSSKVAEIIAKLCTTEEGFLPSGSQVSLPLAFWVNCRMFEALHQWAAENNLQMTLYVDDMTFSGESIPKGFLKEIKAIIYRHGLKINKSKTKIVTNSCHPIEITGIILKQNTFFPPARQYQKLHLALKLWNELLHKKEMEGFLSVHKSRLIGMLNHFAQFDPKYQNIKKSIEKEYQAYLAKNSKN